MKLSHDAKESIKTALAMTIAYGVALQMGWDKPYWAGFAVAFISLATVGQSLNKATLRMVGTVVGAIMALTLIGLFAQQRWLFMLFLSLWLAVCTYMNTGSRHQYFWFVAGFVSVIIAADGGADAANAFAIAMVRLQQTGLGILTYSLVAILLWPHHSKKDLEATARGQTTTQHKLFSASMQLLKNAGDGATVKPLRTEEITGGGRLAELLDAATADSEEVREMEPAWRHYQQATGELAEAMQRWREDFSELQSLSLQQLLPGLDDFALELDRRFTGMASMMRDEAARNGCADIVLEFDSVTLGAQSHFHRAALLVAQRHMLRIEELTRVMFENISAISGFSTPGDSRAGPVATQAPRVTDPDRMLAAGKIMLIMWLAFLAVVYIGDFPGGLGFLGMCGPIGIILVSTPQLPVRLLFKPLAVGIGFAAVLYIFVMPQLSSFTGLGIMIFTATFLICYRYASPQQALGRALGLAMFVVIISVSNQQSYSFLSVANTALMFPLLFLLISIVAYIPYSSRPERALLQLLRRYFRSAEFLVSQSTTAGKKTALEARRDAFHRQELATLPAKLNAWAAHADPAALGAPSVQQLPALVNSLQALTYRLQELQEVRGLPQSALLAAALTENMRAWRQRIIEAFQHLSEDPSYRKTLLRARLDERLEQLEKHIEECLDKTDGSSVSHAEQQNFYRLLGAYRGTSEALLDFADRAANVDWEPWYEERFA
jgi:uncharacterized membrane protein YccC